MRSIVLLLAIGCVGACAHRKDGSGTTVLALEVAPEEKLGIDDVFEVRVVGEADLTGQFRVANDGTVDFPFAGRLFLLGKNSGDVQQIITEKLKDGYLKNPQVSVMVKEWNSRKVVVLGQVAKPGSVAYFPSMTIVDAIAAAGGFTPIADKNTVIVRRELKGRVETRTYRVADISEGKSPNVSVRPGDLLMVEERMF